MKKPEITPGPWNYDEGFIVGRFSDGNIYDICDPRCAPSSPDTSPEMDANATAIAALPDLLEALEVATNLLDKAANGEPVMVAAEIGRCRAALTKAGYTFD